jgi:RNA polymerase sigma factor (sigma-70 family)
MSQDLSSPAEPVRLSFDDYFIADYRNLINYAKAQDATLSEAEDAVQEILLDAFTKWDSIQTPKAYCRRALRNHLARHQQKARTVKDAERQHLNGLAVLDVLKPRFEEEFQAVLEIVKTMPADRREVMAWALSGCTPSEIAEYTGRNAATVRSHLRHARDTLARELAHQYEPIRKE